MFKHEDTYERGVRGETEDLAGSGLAQRLPGRPARVKKKTRKPTPLAPDAKRYNDDIPDPDSEVVVPE
jgi:hypothetical protein